MGAKTIKVEIAGIRLEVPLYRSEDATRQLAELVTERFRSIEASSPRIDTHAFALRTAFEFARELDEARRDQAKERSDAQKQQQSEAAELLLVLDEIATSLESLSDEFTLGE